MKPKSLMVNGGLAVVLIAVAVIWFGPWQGGEAPDVTFRTLDGNQIALRESGHPTLVTFWATDCVTCVAEIPHLKQLYKDLHGQGLNLVAVAMSYDPPDQVRAMRRERKLPYAIALDANGRYAKAFGNIQVTPTTFLVDPDGRIVQRTIGELNLDRTRKQIQGMLADASRS